MKKELFDELAKARLLQRSSEWELFLEICDVYMKNRGIDKPVVVEIGVYKNRQKRFYEQLLGAEHIGIDISTKNCTPDIQGNSHDPVIFGALKKRLNGRSINILFIDGDHSYESIKKDLEMYSPLCTDIVAIHDIETYRYRDKKGKKVHIFWDELTKLQYEKTEENSRLLFISIHLPHLKTKKLSSLGIGLIIKR